jgi:hypothetical protein
MPLSKFVAQERARLVSFLDDPDAVVFDLRVTPERQTISVRLLADIAEKEDHLFVAVDGSFQGADEFCTQIEQALLEGAQAAKAALAEEAVKLDLPGQMLTADQACGAGPEERLVALGELIARELYPFFAGVVAVVRPVLPGDVRDFVACLARLTSHAESGRFKLILVHGTPSPLVSTNPLPRQRLLPYWVSAGKTPQAALLEMVSAPSAPTPAPPPAPAHGFDLWGTPTQIATCWTTPAKPIELPASATRARDLRASMRQLVPGR